MKMTLEQHPDSVVSDVASVLMGIGTALNQRCGKVISDMTFVLMGMVVFALVMINTFPLGRWGAVAGLVVYGLSVARVITKAQVTGHQFFFEPALRKCPWTIVPIMLIVALGMFMPIVYGVCWVLGV